MYVSEILSRPTRLPMDEVQVALYKRSMQANEMSASTYSHFDSGICPDASYQPRTAQSSPDEGDLPVMMERSAFTLPKSCYTNNNNNNNNNNEYLLRGAQNGCCTYSLTRNSVRRPPSGVMISTSKQSETQSLFPSSSSSSRKSRSSRNCVLCVLIVAVLLFSLVIALFIGQWASDGYIAQLSQNGSLSNFTKAAKAFLFPPDNMASRPLQPVLTTAPTFAETVINFTSTTVTVSTTALIHRNLSVSDVYPPAFIEDFAPAFHRSVTPRSPDNPIIYLPKNVKPVHYDLILDLTEYSTGEHIHGNISILFESFGNSTDNEIVFHAASNIFIHRLRIRHDGRPVGIKTVKRQFKRDLVRVQSKQRLKATWYTLEMEFRTRICQSSIEGAQCLKTTIPNSTREVITSFSTKFEPTFARTFIPCWDEPSIKTTFNISIRQPKNVTVLTNVAPQPAPSNNGTDDGLVHYLPTHKMPVYLLAFVVGDYIPLEMRTDRNMPLTVWVSKEDVASATFAANFSPVIFDRVEEEFGVLYPISKMDFVAVKGFPVGGMENFGLVLYNDLNILLPAAFTLEKNITVDCVFEQYKIEKIITHEIVHQWFGNLVTMYDWPELWLNEGFASYFVFDFLNDNHPHLTDNEYYIRLIELLDRQTSISRIPLVRQLETIEDIDNMFDGLQLYTKGAVVVKMIKDLLGSFDFRAGISKFLKKNAYKSVTKDNLWASLSTYADHGAESEKLSDVMESWLVNEGMPEVIISRNYEDHTIRITQRVSDQNRYIIYLNDATFKAASEQGVRSKRSDSDEGFIEIDQDDGLVDSLDKQNLRMQNAINGDNISTFFEQMNLDKRKPKTVKSSVESGETIFDDTFFYVESTATPVSREKSSQETKLNHGMRAAARRKMKEAIKLSAYIESTEMSPEKMDETTDNKIPLFTNHLKKGILARLRPTKFNLQNLDNGPVNIEEHQKKHRRRIHSSPTTWSIPFSYWFGSAQSSSGQTVRQFWVHNETIRFVDVELNAEDYILANPHWVYPFKINYDLDNWKMLISQLHRHPEEIATMSRAQLIVDAETYLKQSGVPYLYVKLLSYLSKETDLGVLLVGLDAVHSLVDLFSATSINGPLLLYFNPVMQQFDKMLERTSSDPEVAAVWLLSPQRLSKLYQLRCIANFGSCQQNQQVDQWLAFPTALSAEHHQQITAICHYLFTQSGPKEVALLAGLLRQKTTQWPVILQLATCVRDETLIEEAVSRIVKSRNAAVYVTVLQGSYSIQYNRKFREIFWKGIFSLSLHERQMLFAVNTGKSDRIAQLLLHSVRGSEELEAVVQLLPEWPSNLQIHIDYVRRKFAWVEKTAVKQIQNFLIQESN